MPKGLKENMKLNWNFWRAGGSSRGQGLGANQTLRVGYGYFLKPLSLNNVSIIYNLTFYSYPLLLCLCLART